MTAPGRRSVDTHVLLVAAKGGDQHALEALFARYAPRLQRWAARRLPISARGMADTQDVVQDALLDTFRHFNNFEVRGEGALLAYLRRSVLNRIINESRRVKRRGVPEELDCRQADGGPSPLEQAIGRDKLARYERALGQLSVRDREAIIGRLEMGCSYDELANALHFPSPAAARKALERAVKRLAEAMANDR